MYKKIIINTFDTVFKNQNGLFQKLLIPIILLTIINYYLPQFINNEIFITGLNINAFKIQYLFPVILLFLTIMINISIAITTHRIAILGEGSVPKFGSYILGLRELKFLFKSVLMAFIIAIPVILSFFIPIIGPIIAIILFFLLISRLSFVYPAISCDEKMSFFQAWKNTRNYKMLSIFAIVIFPLIFSFTVGFIYTLAIEFLIKIVSSKLIILYSLLNVFIMVFSISALSSFYLLIKPQAFNNIIKKENNTKGEILVTKRKNLHKIVIDDSHDISFASLKKELIKQYHELSFNDIALDRERSFLLRTPQNIEAYVSLRYEDDRYIIQTNQTDEPKLEILKLKT